MQIEIRKDSKAYYSIYMVFMILQNKPKPKDILKH